MEKARKRLVQAEKDYFDAHLLPSLASSTMTQAKIAEAVGVTRGAIIQWKSKNSYPQVEVFIRLANLFGWNLNDIDSDIIELRNQIEPVVESNSSELDNATSTLSADTHADDRYLLIKDDLAKLSDTQFMNLMVELKRMSN